MNKDKLYDVSLEQDKDELKCSLTNTELEKLISYFDLELFQFKHSRQVFYVDKEEKLKDFPIQSLAPALFVRDFDGIHILFLRIPAAENGIHEVKDVLNEQEYENFVENGILPKCNITRVLKKFNIKGPFNFFGDMVTERAQVTSKIPADSNAKVYLLKFSLPGGNRSSEIRVYSSRSGEASDILGNILLDNGIQLKETTPIMKKFYVFAENSISS